jgi:hypothetical protein
MSPPVVTASIISGTIFTLYKNFPNQTFNNYPKPADFLSQYKERIEELISDLNRFFIKEIMRVIE